MPKWGTGGALCSRFASSRRVTKGKRISSSFEQLGVLLAVDLAELAEVLLQHGCALAHVTVVYALNVLGQAREGPGVRVVGGGRITPQ